MTPLASRDLTIRYRNRSVLSGISLELRQGEVYGLTGPNGAGKSTLLKALCGLVPAAAGGIRICGHDLASERTAALGRLGYVAQRFGLYADLTVEENVRFYAGCYGLPRAGLDFAVERTLRHLQMEALRTSTVSQLSHGWSQRLALAVATCHQPRVLLLDETTTGLDSEARERFWTTLQDLVETGTTVLLATHYKEDLGYCTRIGRIENGGLREVAA